MPTHAAITPPQWQHMHDITCYMTKATFILESNSPGAVHFFCSEDGRAMVYITGIPKSILADAARGQTHIKGEALISSVKA